MRLILVRHGQTSANVNRALDTAEPGAPLTRLGHDQARLVAEALVGEGVSGIFTSHLMRTRQTARPLAQRLGAKHCLTLGTEGDGSLMNLTADQPAPFANAPRSDDDICAILG